MGLPEILVVVVMLVLAGAWFGLPYLIAKAAQRRGRSFAAWFTVGIFISPVFLYLAFLIFGRNPAKARASTASA